MKQSKKRAKRLEARTISWEKLPIDLKGGQLGIMPHQFQAIIWTVYRRIRD